MSDPLLEVYQELINNQSLSELMDTDNIHSIRVPDDFQKKDKAPIIRINELDYYRAGWADDQVRFFNTEIQIDVWTQRNALASKITFLLDDIMAGIDFQQYKTVTDVDPDIDLIRKARRYRAKKQFVKE